ncbi:MAG: tetratricopeptide repeat protein [Candidatus Amoebophilus sp.]
MCKVILIKTRQGAIHRYIKNIALGIALVIASTNFHTCVSNGAYQVGSHLKMEVSSGVDRHMDVHFGLSDDVEEASLAGYALNVNLIVLEGEQNTNNLLEYRNRSGEGKRASSINKPLNYFIEEEKLNLESEELRIPFKLVPGVGVTKVKVQFLLLNEGGNILSTSYVDWNSSMEDSEIITDNRLMLIGTPKVNEEENIATSVGSVALEQMSMDIVEESPDGSRKRKRNLENISSAMGLNDSVKREEKRAKRLAKGKERAETEVKSGAEVLHVSVEETVIPDVYSRMSEIELVRCANDNSPYAQEAIVRLTLRSGIHAGLWISLTPDKWANIEEKALQDQRYVLLLIYISYFGKYEFGNFFKLPFIEKVIEKVRLAAELGDALAQTNLGYILLLKAKDKWSPSVKREVVKEFYQSFDWFKKAADQGNVHAQVALGRDFYAPDCICKDYESMAAYYTQAAKQGYQEAQFLLGNLYHYGPESKIDDYNWYAFYENLIQAKAGDVEAKSELEIPLFYPYINRNEVDIKKAVYWYNEAAKQGNPEAQYQLAIMCLAGRAIDSSNKRAMELLKESAEKDYGLALSKLVEIYYKGGIEVEEMIYDSKEALKWLIKAAIHDCGGARKILGKIYFKGEQMAQDYSNAFFWFYKAKYFLEKYSLFVTTQSEKEGMPEGSNDMEGGDKGHEALETIEANLLGNYQAMLIQKERDHLGTCATFQIPLYKKLEEIMFKFVQWNHALKTANGLMINSLDFKDPKFKQAIDARQKLTGIIPYIKGHVYQGKSYISFDRPIVQLADEIMEEALNQHLYREAENILNHLKHIYEKLRTKTHKRSIDIETRYHLLDSDLSELDKQKLSQKLKIENTLEEIYTNKLKLLEGQIVELGTYYQALFRQIEKGSGIRNKNFRQERNMILRIEQPYAYPCTLFRFEVVEKDFSI